MQSVLPHVNFSLHVGSIVAQQNYKFLMHCKLTKVSSCRSLEGPKWFVICKHVSFCDRNDLTFWDPSYRKHRDRKYSTISCGRPRIPSCLFVTFPLHCRESLQVWSPQWPLVMLMLILLVLVWLACVAVFCKGLIKS